jgi:hypothetical protein
MVRKLMMSGCVLAVLSWGAPDMAQAQLRGDKAVYFTFSEPVTLPQVTLPAGKYLFRLADSLANRTIVQIYSADGAKLHGMMMTIPTRRSDIPNDAEVRFLETAADAPPAIATYWYPGQRDGWEFIYPRSEATRIAQASKQNVLTTSTESADLKSGDLVRVSPSGEQVAVGSDAREVAVAGEVQRGEIAMDGSSDATAADAAAASRASTTAASRSAAVTTPAPAEPRSTSVVADASVPAERSVARQSSNVSAGMQDPAPAERTALPATASALPTVTLAGILALVAAFVLGLRRRVQA